MSPRKDADLRVWRKWEARDKITKATQDILDYPRLSANARLTYLMMSRAANDEWMVTHLTEAMMMDRLGVDHKEIDRIMEELEGAGLIAIDRSKRTKQYRLFDTIGWDHFASYARRQRAIWREMLAKDPKIPFQRVHRPYDADYLGKPSKNDLTPGSWERRKYAEMEARIKQQYGIQDDT